MARKSTSKLNLSFEAIIPQQSIAFWQDEFKRLGAQRFPRALQFAVNRVAREAQIGIGQAIDRVIDRPVQFSRVTDEGRKSAVRMRGKSLNSRSDNMDLSDVSAGVYVQQKQSSYFKFLMGQTVRRPGDVGPAEDYVAVPYWKNLQELQGINPDAHGNLHKNSLRTLHRRRKRYSNHGFMNLTAGKEKDALWTNRKRDGTYGTTFFGRPSGGIGFPMGWYNRPESIVTRRGPVINGPNKGFRKLVREKAGGPKLLIAALPYTEHEPILLEPWNRAVMAAASRLNEYLNAELEGRLRWQGRYDRVQDMRYDYD